MKQTKGRNFGKKPEDSYKNKLPSLLSRSTKGSTALPKNMQRIWLPIIPSVTPVLTTPPSAKEY